MENLEKKRKEKKGTREKKKEKRKKGKKKREGCSRVKVGFDTTER